MAQPVKMFVLMTALSALLSCKTHLHDESDSAVKFGHLVGWNNKTIATVSPGEQIYFCDKGAGSDATELVRKAMIEWLDVSSLDEVLTTEVGCDTDPMFIPSVMVSLGGCLNSDNWAETLTTASRQWTVRFCRPEARTKDLALHEVGHIFGQCDRYSNEANLLHPAKGVNCLETTGASNAVFDVKSAMQAGGSGHPGKVTLDDADGVAALFAREDVKGAADWRTYIGKLDQKIKLKSKAVTIADGNNISLFIYLSARVTSVEITDGKQNSKLTERRQPQTNWPEIRAVAVDKSWADKSDVQVNVKRLSGANEEISIGISHR